MPLIKQHWVKLLSFLVILASIIVCIFLARGYQQAKKELNDLKNNPQLIQKATETENQQTISAVGKLIRLPTGEEPTIATVTDSTKLRDQKFFQSAKNGDKVIVYSAAAKAILYDPQANIIIDVAPISQTPESPIDSVKKEIKIALYNGTTTVGLTKVLDKIILTKFPQTQISARENAARSDYQESYVVDLTGSNSTLVGQLAAHLETTPGTLPSGEQPPDADILIIIGSKYIKE